jgi:probable HAF family extracellular repeat protein
MNHTKTRFCRLIWLGTLGGWESEASDVSADGAVVVGWAINEKGHKRAFRWTESDGMQDIGTLGGSTSVATSISADGTTIVGWAYTADGFYRAFQWTCKQGMIQIKSSRVEDVQVNGVCSVFGGYSDCRQGISFRVLACVCMDRRERRDAEPRHTGRF